MAKRFWSSLVLGSLGATMMVPSQLMPAKPVDTLSTMPSRTEVITTRAKTPRVRRLSVSRERSLWAQSSTKPPLTTSATRLAWARRPRLGRGAAARLAPASLIAQGFHRGQAAGLPGRIEGEEKAEGAGEAGGPGEADGRQGEGHAEDDGDGLGEGDAGEEAEAGAEEGHQEGLGHEGLEDLAAGGADGPLDADL